MAIEIFNSGELVRRPALARSLSNLRWLAALPDGLSIGSAGRLSSAESVGIRDVQIVRFGYDGNPDAWLCGSPLVNEASLHGVAAYQGLEIELLVIRSRQPFRPPALHRALCLREVLRAAMTNALARGFSLLTGTGEMDALREISRLGIEVFTLGSAIEESDRTVYRFQLQCDRSNAARLAGIAAALPPAGDEKAPLITQDETLAHLADMMSGAVDAGDTFQNERSRFVSGQSPGTPLGKRSSHLRLAWNAEAAAQP